MELEKNVDFENFDEIEKKFENQLNQKFQELDSLKLERIEIGNRKKFIEGVSQAVWEQFIVQIGGTAGQDFIKANHDLKFSLKIGDHFLSTKNFDKGNLPSHNFENIDKYQTRYDVWNRNFTDQNHYEFKNNDYRKAFDANRPMGNVQYAKDHTIPVAEIVRNKRAATYMDLSDLVNFANDENFNLKDLDTAANQSKRDRPMAEWLNSRSAKYNNQTPAERFNIDKEELLQRDADARKELESRIDDSEQTAHKEGVVSLFQEVGRVAIFTAEAVALALFAKLTRTIIVGIIKWMASKKRTVKELMMFIKNSILEFLFDFKNNLVLTAEISILTILTTIFGAIVPKIHRAILFFYYGGKTVVQVSNYLANPTNSKKDLETKMLEIGRISVGGATTMGSFVLSDVISYSLVAAIPALGTFHIPLLGSIPNIFGVFFGGLTAGISGAIILFLINEKLKGKMINENLHKRILVSDEIIDATAGQYESYVNQLNYVENKSINNIIETHKKGSEEITRLKDSLNDSVESDNKEVFDELNKLLNGEEK